MGLLHQYNPYYTRFFPAKQGEIVTKEFFHKGVEIGGINWYNKKIEILAYFHSQLEGYAYETIKMVHQPALDRPAAG